MQGSPVNFFLPLLLPFFLPNALIFPLPLALSLSLQLTPLAPLPAAESWNCYECCPIRETPRLGRDKNKKRAALAGGARDKILRRETRGGAMLGSLRREKPSWLRPARWSGGSSCSQPAFVTLSHGSRSFHHKIRPAPQPSVLENFRAVTAFAAAKPLLHFPLTGLHLRIAPVSRNGYRFYSRSSTPSTMAQVDWTGPRVRKTFLDFFAERGHTIGRQTLPPKTQQKKRPPLRALQLAQKKTTSGCHNAAAAVAIVARRAAKMPLVLCGSLSGLLR